MNPLQKRSRAVKSLLDFISRCSFRLSDPNDLRAQIQVLDTEVSPTSLQPAERKKNEVDRDLLKILLQQELRRAEDEAGKPWIAKVRTILWPVMVVLAVILWLIFRIAR